MANRQVPPDAHPPPSDTEGVLLLAEVAEVAEARSFADRHRWLMPWVVALSLLAIWETLAALRVFPAILLPSPLAVGREAIILATSGYGGQVLFTDIWVSVGRISAGFLLAVVIGVPVGLIMASSDPVFTAVDPVIQFVRPVPPLAYIPLLVAWFGIGELPKVMLILLGTLPIIVISTISGVRSTPRHRVQTAQCLGATPFQVFRYVTFPSALPEVFTGMRVGIGVAWTCLVAAEIIAAAAGLGWLIQYAGQELQIGIIFVGITAIGVLGYTMELVIRLIERALVPWKGHV